MEAQKLSIGNKITRKSSPNTICTVNWAIIKEIELGEPTEYIPIILTEEWHNKFGVKKNGFGSFEYDICPFGKKSRVLIFSGDYLYIRDMSGKDRTEDDLITIWNKDIKKEFYVHEFQNLYLSFTGKKLTIKEND